MSTKKIDTAKAAPEEFFAAMTLPDLASALSALVSMRTTAGLTSNLANHMKRDNLEDFADALSEALGDQIEAIEAELLSRSPLDAADIADRDELLAIAVNTLRPGERGTNMRIGRAAHG
ncbi:hypothetical protein [Agrobacterium genomosp. 13]|uniref:Uncharacterized protein n=1 Tax=Agrobacterium genomosp. 13 str. CFBP 6927 TaxID=1183428 RepID=A0ABM9VFN1_9HYPH|nr:hypothetical protein [Agrobacterium genomosp. 13]CUX31961.1 hypothetical protein AGR13a_Cc30162 [Agrobacterium genomosp. 13 str. CFBP 6927]